jgi:steroid delta-isomerase-like uncharacterized protein
MSQDNVATSRRLFEEAWSKGNLDVIDELVSPGAIDHDPMGDRDVDGVKEAIQGYRAAFPDLTITIDDIFAVDDKVVVRWTADGTFESEFMGQQPTGERGNPVEGIAIDRYDDDGQLAESWGQWNMLAFMQNIGLVPAQEAATA